MLGTLCAADSTNENMQKIGETIKDKVIDNTTDDAKKAFENSEAGQNVKVRCPSESWWTLTKMK